MTTPYEPAERLKHPPSPGFASECPGYDLGSQGCNWAENSETGDVGGGEGPEGPLNSVSWIPADAPVLVNGVTTWNSVLEFQNGQDPLTVTTLDASGNTTFENLDELTNMTTFKAEGSFIDAIPTLPASVTTLLLGSNSISSLAGMPAGVVTIDFNNNAFTGPVSEALGDLTVFTSMISLSFAGNAIHDDGGSSPFAFPPNIQVANLSSNPQLNSLVHPLPVSLTTLDLSDAGVSDNSEDEQTQILIDLDNNGQNDGAVVMTKLGGETCTSAGLDARENLLSKGWTVILNGFDSAVWTPNTIGGQLQHPGGFNFDDLGEFREIDPTTIEYIEFDPGLDTIQGLDGLTVLTSFVARDSNLISLGSFPGTMIYIDATNNALTQNIADIFDDCPLLEEFYVGDNDLSGSVPNFPADLFAIELNGNGPFTSIGNLSVPLVYGIFTDCGFDETAIDSILQQLVDNAQTDGELDISGTNADPSGAGAANITTLQGRGWIITTN